MRFFRFSQNFDVVFRLLTMLRFAVCPFLCGFSVFAEFSYGCYQNLERFLTTLPPYDDYRTPS